MMIVSLSFVSCDFFADGDLERKDTPETPSATKVSSLKLDKTKLNLKVGSIDYIGIIYRPTDADFEPFFTYDETKIEVTSQKNGVIITGLQEGQTPFTVTCDECSATCIITVSGYEAGYEKTVDPYIYSNTNIIQLSPGLSEKVFVSLYGGSAADINSYTWSVEDKEVCNIEQTGQYCLIKAKNAGYTRIKVSHPKALYPYYMGVYVFEDPAKATYITTANNIVTMNQDDGEQTISVSLVNSLDNSRESDFSWELINENSSENPISFVSNGNKAIITPETSGYCTLRISHPDAVYPLDILCRVITIVKNVYIEPNKTVVILNGDKEEIISSKLVNIETGDYSLNGYQYQIEDTEVAEIVATVGESVYLKGLKNGSTKLIISHSKSAYTREVLLISTNQLADAVDASCYITTSNNYIRTKVGNAASEINVSLKGGEEGDEKDFSWTVENYASDGSADNVISLETPTGSVFYNRMASQTLAFGNSYVTPLKKGTAIIKVTHPKVLYPTEILVKVLSEESILEEQLFFKGEGLVRILNGETYDYTISLGNSKKKKDYSDISWAIDDDRLSVNGNEDKAEIRAPVYGTGCTISHLTISHPKVDVSKSVLIMTADDEETLMNMKALYTHKDYYNIEVGKSLNLNVETVGFNDTYDETSQTVIPYDYSLLSWSVNNPGIIDYTCDSSDKRFVNITALKSGTVKLKASLEGYECTFTITVYPVGAVQTEPEMYFTTTQNVLIFNELNTAKKVNISAINMPVSYYSQIEWTCNNDVCSVISNGVSATITALKEGEAVISVEHPQSQNTLKIYVRVGSEYVSEVTESVVYIKSEDIIPVVIGQDDKKLSASLINYTSPDVSGFSFICKDTSIAKITSQSTDGTAFISGIKKGYTEIEITHKSTKVSKSVIVVVGQTQQEVIEMLQKSVYFTTPDNIVTLRNIGKSSKISISAVNLDKSKYSEISWKVADESIVQVNPNGISATVVAKNKGRTTVSVSHPDSINLITFYVFVDTDDIVVVEKNTEAVVYIKAQDVISVIIGQDDKKLSASLVNWTLPDVSGFNFTIKDSSIADISSQSTDGTAFIRGVKKGYTEVEITHKSTKVSKSVIVVVGQNQEEIQKEVDEVITKSVYFTTANNTVTLKKVGKSSMIGINAVNLDASRYSEITWKTTDDSIAQVIPNGISATVLAKGTGRTTITVSHPQSINSITFYVFVDTEDVVIVEPDPTTDPTQEQNPSSTTEPETGKESVVYIKSDDVVTIVIGQDDKKLSASLENWTSQDVSGFSFTCKDTSIAKIATQSTYGTAFIRGVKKGYTEVVITHTASKVSKSVIVIVGQNQEEIQQEINEVLKEPVYFTTANNTVALKNIGYSSRIGVSVMNLASSRYSEITWKSSDESIAQVYPNGVSATVVAKATGRTTITVTHPDSINKITFYVFVNTEDIVISTDKIIYIASQDLITLVKDDQPQKLQAILVNYDGADGEQFNFSIDNENVAKISAQSPNGTAFIKPVGSGQTEVTITNPLTNINKKVLVVVGNSTEELAGFSYLTTSNNVVSIGEGKTRTVSVSVKNSDEVVVAGYSWESSNRSIADVVSNGATASIIANGVGTAVITVTNKVCKYPLQIIVHVVDPIAASAHPYIQLNSSVVVLTVGDSYQSISADLVGGTDDDKAMFNWMCSDPSICMVYGQNEVGKIKAIDEGTATVTVSHPKADYNAQLLVICERKTKSECYISVPSSIINMKPTDESTSITASLINGTANDKYNFTWSLDVYDIIDFQYSANVCTIKPKQAGSATITISHPKADYDQQIIVNVQEYTEFAFPSTNITITQGDAKFLDMHVPNTSVKTYIEYKVKNEKICSVEGTKQVAQIKGITPGTTTVTAELIAVNTQTVQASCELMVYVKERATTDAYITSTSTTYTVNKGKSQTLKASIIGTDIVVSDQADLKWTTSASDIISIAGLGDGTDGYVRGQSIYITAKKSGYAIITCSHDKASSDLEFYVVVPGTDKKIVTLNKSAITIVKGSSGVALNANIENAESNDDYNNLKWTSVGPNGVNGSTIARIMGSVDKEGNTIGKNVQIYPVSVGEVEIYAQLPDSDSVGKCTVIVEAGKSLVVGDSGLKVAPHETKEITYKVSPANAILTWQRNSDDDYFSFKDLGFDADGNGKLQISGIREGQGMILGSTDGGATVRITVKCGWTYDFKIDGATRFNISDISPSGKITYKYTVTPADAEISVESSDLDDVFSANVEKLGTIKAEGNAGTSSSYGIIEIIPLKETDINRYVNIKLVARNKLNNAIVGEQNISGYIKYKNLDVELKKFAKNIGKWSKCEDNVITIGDGETVSLEFAIKNTNYTGFVKEAKFVPLQNSAYAQELKNEFIATSNRQDNEIIFQLEHTNDHIDSEKMYLIHHLYAHPDYKTMQQMHNFQWYCYYHSYIADFTRYYDDYLKIKSPSGSQYGSWYEGSRLDSFKDPVDLIELEQYTETYMSIDELKNNPWLWCPGTVSKAKEDVYYSWADILSGRYVNGSYGSGGQITIGPQVWANHCDCELVTVVTQDDTEVSCIMVGNVVVTVSHFGADQPEYFSFPIYLTVRNTPCK